MDTRERDAYIAEHLMGFVNTRIADASVGWNTSSGVKGYPIREAFGDLDGTLNLIPEYGRLHSDAFEMEEKIAERGMENEYLRFLARAFARGEKYIILTDHWGIVHATPAQRAEACYQMLKAREGN